MKNYKLKIMTVAGLIFATSCSKQLDLLPIDSVVAEGTLVNVPNLERGIVGVYASFNGTYGNDIYATSLYSDEAFLPGENNTGRGVIAFRWQTDPGIGEVTAAWGAYYLAIDRANRILAAAPRITPANATEQVKLANIVAEAYALRAFGHLQLLINFAEGFDPNSKGVPYMESSVVSKPARLPVGEVFTKIFADLTEASSRITAANTDVTRITPAGVAAIRARAALYAKNYPLAISSATEAINAAPLATRAQYPAIWTDQANTEVIWKLKRTTGQGRIGDNYFDRTQQLIMYSPSLKLRNSLITEDVRLSTLVSEIAANRFRMVKYNGGDAAEPNRADIKVFRTSEMYLIRAEAHARSATPNLVAATNDLNTLRSNRITNYTNQSFATVDALIGAVLQERFIELAFEGQRMGDLRRNLLPVARLAADAANAQGSVNLAPTNDVYYYPIPDFEILANENMVQNSGYDQ